jgi:hypothetical protein
MKNKDIIAWLKKKADDVDVPDLAESIIDRVARLPKTTTAKPVLSRSWWRPMLKTSFAVMVLVLTFVLLQTTTRPDTLTLDEETIALSSVMSASLANDVFTDRILLQSAEETTDSNLIDDELDGLGNYFHLMEHLFASDPSFEVTDAGSAVSYQKHMRFSSSNFLDEQMDYHLYYDLLQQDESTIAVEGLLATPNGAYFVSARTQMDASTQSFLYRIVLADGYAIESTLIDTKEERRYTIDVFEGDVSTEQFDITIEKNERSHVFLQFLSGTHRGTYRFSLDRENNDEKPVLAVKYAMIVDDRKETGRIDIRLKESMETGSWTYDYRVKPQGEDVYHYERARLKGKI